MDEEQGIRITCRGKHVLSVEERQTEWDATHAAEASGDLASARAGVAALRERIGRLHPSEDMALGSMIFVMARDGLGREKPKEPLEVVPSATLLEVLGAWRRLAGAHVGCGQDLTEIAMAQPHDGETHHYECPKCGEDQEVRHT